LDSSNKERIERRARESKAALDLDMRIVKEFMMQDSVEKESKHRKKDELRTEMLEYKTYLEQMRKYERMRDDELDSMYRSEEDRIWNMRNEKWLKEQAARDRLMTQVLDGRKEQLRFAGIILFYSLLAERNKMQIEETRKDMQTLSLSIAKGKEKDVVVQEELARRHGEYSSDLQKQIRETEDRRQAELEREQREVNFVYWIYLTRRSMRCEILSSSSRICWLKRRKSCMLSLKMSLRNKYNRVFYIDLKILFSR
jgi:hypothetical protein